MIPLSNALNLSNVWFYLFAAVALTTAVCVVTMRNIVHCAMFLAVTFISVAAIYVLLEAEFIAAIQILIYVGAVTVLILFAIMLSRKYAPQNIRHHNSQSIPAFFLISLFLIATGGILAETWRGVMPAALKTYGDLTNTQLIGIKLMRAYALPFEIASVLLLVAMVGAIIIARRD